MVHHVQKLYLNIAKLAFSFAPLLLLKSIFCTMAPPQMHFCMLSAEIYCAMQKYPCIQNLSFCVNGPLYMRLPQKVLFLPKKNCMSFFIPYSLLSFLPWPGLFFVLPCIETYQKVDLRTITLDVPPQEVAQPAQGGSSGQLPGLPLWLKNKNKKLNKKLKPIYNISISVPRKKNVFIYFLEKTK